MMNQSGYSNRNADSVYGEVESESLLALETIVEMGPQTIPLNILI